MSSAAAKPAVLSSSLLVRRGAPSRPAEAPLPNDERANPNTTSPFDRLFYIKGAASAEQFRSRIRRAAHSAIAVPKPALPSLPFRRPRPRLWMRVDAEYRVRVKRAASARGQTSQDFL